MNSIICKNCGKEIKKYNNKWFHFVHFTGIDNYESYSFETHNTVGTENIECKECGNIKTKLKVCKNPEPRENRK